MTTANEFGLSGTGPPRGPAEPANVMVTLSPTLADAGLTSRVKSSV
jgi:hypothetical protein